MTEDHTKNPDIYQNGHYWNKITKKFDLQFYDQYVFYKQQAKERYERAFRNPYYRNQETGMWLNSATKQYDIPTYEESCKLNSKFHLAKRQKEYRERHKEKIAERSKEYREKNKKEIMEKKKEWSATKGKEEVECECGSKVKRENLSRHRKSNRHVEKNKK